MILLDLLLDAARTHPDVELVCLGGETRSNQRLLQDARRVAGAVAETGIAPGDPVVCLIQQPSDFFPAFWGVIYAGGIPVPLSGPRSMSMEEIRRVQRVVAQVDGPVVVDRGVQVPGYQTHDIGDWLTHEPLAEPVRREGGVGMIQFSSGSTRDPKGALLSQAALLANVRQVAEVTGCGPEDVLLNWLPHFHDMGLIACHLMPLLTGMRQVRMNPLDIIRDPLGWVRLLSEHQVTIATTTNFALARVVSAIKRSGLSEVDLSRFRLLANGGEPVSPAVCRAFSRLTGVPETVHWPVYGLAEACVGLAAFASSTLEASEGLNTREVDGQEVVIIGPPLPGIRFRVLGEDGEEVPEGEVGRLEFQGPNAYSGYLGGEPVSGWIDTGDLVVMRDGTVSVVGREKDVIIVNARNLFPHDIEYAAENVDGVRPGGAVAVVDERDGHEDLAVLVRVDAERNAVPLLREVRRRVAAEVGVEPGRVWSIAKVPRTTSGKKRRAWLAKQLAAGELDHSVSPGTVEAVRGLWSEQLGVELADEDLETGFRELGGASIQAVELVTRIEQEFDVAPDLRLLTEGESVVQMARLLERMNPREEVEAVRGIGPVAIVGAAMRLPGDEDLHSLAEDGPSRIGRPSDGRWGEYVGGFVEPEDFDPARFGVAPAVAEVMDPQQRMVLALADELLGAAAGERSVGVFVGAGQQAYIERVLPRLGEALPPGTMAANLLNMIAARVAHTFDLRGPALTVDTACSSALVALHLAVRSMEAGECRLALAGGVNLLVTPTAHRLFEVAGALSPSGQCTPFAGGDGMIPGEGAGLVLLAPLDEAKARGWPVLGVLRGSAINNDGTSLGVMAPNPVGQEAVIRSALAAAGVEASEVRFVEAHGTGTPVGDSVEEAVLRRVYPHGPERGAVKGRIGHLLSAAGIAGLFDALAHLGPGELGAVSSFGFGGTNAHLLVEGGADRPERVRRRPSADGWVHVVRKDLAGGMVWTPVPAAESVLGEGLTAAVTGGSGALGRVLTDWLIAEHGASVAWVGRSAPQDLPEGVRFVQGDLADATDARRVADEVGAVDVLFHLAGGGSEAALRAKRVGAERLAGRADRVVLYSSISAVLPGMSEGIEDYAAANAVLDAWAREQRALGKKVTSIAWPPWSGGGLAAGRTEALKGAGVRPIDPERAMVVLERAIASEEPQVVVLDRPMVDVGPLPDDLSEWLRSRVAEAAQLHPKQVGLDDPLPSLGLDSVAALDLVKELEERLGRKLPTTLAYEGGSLGGILAILARGTVREVARAEVPELLPSQQTFVVQQRYFPTVPGNTLMRVRLSPGLDREALTRALTALTVRHPALGAAIRREDGAWKRVAGAPPELRWVDAVDLQAVHEEPFDLERGPVLRVVSDGRELVLDAHHALVDAWSLRNALLDLLELHRRAVAGEELALPPLRTSVDEAVAAVAAGSGGDPGWWRARFAEPLPPLNLPWSAPADRPAAPPCYALKLGVDQAQTAGLEARARALGITLPALVLAAWAHALWRSSGTGNLAVRVAQGRREARLPDLDRVVGSFADSLPVRLEVRPTEDVADFAVRVAAELADVRDRAGASAMGLAGLGDRGGAGPVGLTPAGFSFPLLPTANEIAGQRISEVFGASASGFTRVGLICWRFDGRLEATLNALGSHLDRATCDALVATVLEVLRELAEPAPRATTLHGRILARCAEHPERRAVGALSYGELDAQSAVVALRVRGPRVAVLAYPSEEAVVAVLGVLRSGAAYLPLDPGWPDARIAQVLEIGSPTAIVAPQELVERARGFGIPVVVLDGAEAAGGPDVDGPVAYVMCTSGTTGRPKGVVMSHAASLCFVDWCIAAFGIGPGDRLAQTSSLGFGGSIRQMFASLVAGATVEPVPRGLTRDPDGLVRFLAERRITLWNSVPSLWTHLMGAMERTGKTDPLPEVRWVLLGGEAVPAAHVRRWRERFGDRIRLADVYGSTETAHNATWFEVTGEIEGAHTPIGWSRAGTVAHLVDERDGVGEIVVSGAIADGYLDAPEQTAAAFVDLPGLGRVYRTGDLARRRADGALVYLGRADAQVQVRGNRVELGEVEFVLCEHPEVRHALVSQRPDGRLHAAVEGEVEAEPLRTWLSERLPGFMVPHTWEVADALPRTAAGKRDRKALTARLAAEPMVAEGPVAEQLAEAWVAVLGLSATPGPTDDFFALGGDSLTLLEVVDRMRERVAIDSPLPLYRHGTLARMAAWLEARPAVAEAAPAVAVRERASVVERGFWMAHRADPEHPPLWTASVPLQGALDLEAFRAALALVVRRHPMLRATWDDEGMREILDRPAPLLQVDDLSSLPPQLRSRAVEGRLAEAGAARLAMDRWAPWTVRLCRLGSTEHVLILAVHHAVADGWSAWQLTRELLEAHAAHAHGRTPELPPAQPFRPPAPPRPDPWWEEALADLAQAPAAPRTEDHEVRFSLDPGRWGRLQRLAASEGVSPFAWVAAALAGVLQRELGTVDVVLSTALAGRPAGAAHSVGPYARALPVRVRGTATARTVADALAEAADHGSAPPWQVVAAAGTDGAARLGRFFLTWLDPSAVLPAGGELVPDWRAGAYRFATRSTDTEVLVGALVSEGLHVHLHGGPRVVPVGRALEAALREATRSRAALVVYAPDGAVLPARRPLVVEQVDAGAATSELVFLPRHASQLVPGAELDAAVSEAVGASEAGFVALAGMLPALTGLAARPLGREGQRLTTGHGATVVAMVRTVEALLARTGRSWSELRVGFLGYGAIGRAVHALAVDRMGTPAEVQLRDPRLPESVDALDVDLVIGATSGGKALEVDALRPGTLVVDDSFPRCFEDVAARARMERDRDVVLVGGGMIDGGELVRWSPFAEAAEVRSKFPSRWLPGCHAEALLLAIEPELGPSVGVVDADRARAVWDAVERAGWDVPPFHLAGWEIPDEVLDGAGKGRR